MPTDSPHPLLFEPILKEKVWGDRRLAAFGKALPPGAMVGESWEIADLGSTSASGGGGDAARSVIRNGPRAGSTIHDVVRDWGADLLGAPAPTPDHGFPLLIKFLDAGQNLSVQVHPSPAYAAAHPEAHLKHEAWCVVDARPGSFIYRGLKAGVTRDELARRVREGDVAGALVATPATPGEIVHLPSGVVHALGAGVLVAEVQTPSDTTFRLDDWGRQGRELHVDAALACAFDATGAQTVPSAALPPAARDVVATHAFRIERVELAAGDAPEFEFEHSPLIVMALRGSARLTCGETTIELSQGDTALIPAALRRCDARGVGALLAITIP